MTKSNFYKVKIEDKNGKVITEIKTDCIMAAINDIEKDATAGLQINSII